MKRERQSKNTINMYWEVAHPPNLRYMKSLTHRHK